MKQISILLFLSFFFACKSSHSQRKTPPEAVRLNKQAQYLIFNQQGPASAQIIDSAITLLNQATKIDSQYFSAYNNKFTYQNELKRYTDAISTGKQMIILRPNDCNIKLMVGEDYEKNGDTLTSKSYYDKALSNCDQSLDAINVSNQNYNIVLLCKAVTLIMLHREKQGYALLNDIAAKETDPAIKQMYQQFSQTSRNDWLYWNFKKDPNISEDPVNKKK